MNIKQERCVVEIDGAQFIFIVPGKDDMILLADLMATKDKGKKVDQADQVVSLMASIKQVFKNLRDIKGVELNGEEVNFDQFIDINLDMATSMKILEGYYEQGFRAGTNALTGSKEIDRAASEKNVESPSG